MVRHGTAERHGALPSGLVAAIAIRVRRRQLEVAADVARSARCGYVRALQRKARRGVIELAVCPEQGVVAGRAL